MIDSIIRVGVGLMLAAMAAAMAIGSVALSTIAPWWMFAPCIVSAVGFGCLAVAVGLMAAGVDE